MTDLPALHDIMANQGNRVYLPAGPAENVAATHAWIGRFGARWDVNGIGYWTIRLRAAAQVIGVGGVDRRRGFWNLYYLIDSHHWGHGYATELARAAQRAAATVDADLPLAAWIHRDNTGSQIVAQRLGLNDYGRLEPGHWKGQPMHYWADKAPDDIGRESPDLSTDDPS
jgi:RimJ/RimL family protein N-acetyltransferase